MQKSNKLTFRSVVFLVIGSVIGAGIFFKTQTVLKYSNQNVWWSFLAWFIATFTVIFIGIALIEIIEEKSKNNLSLLAWNKRFNSPFVSNFSKYFLLFIYQPLNYFFMPFYVIMSFLDAMDAWGYQAHFGTYGWIWITIASIIIGLFFTITGISSRVGNILNWVISIINYLPIIAAIVLGIIILSKTHQLQNTSQDTVWFQQLNEKGEADFGILTWSPLIGIFGAIGGIFFAFDGFYFASGVRNDMKEPHRISKAVFWGLVIISITYISVAMVMSFAVREGKFSGYNTFLQERNLHAVAGLFNLTIAIGVFSIINGISLWIPRFIEDLIQMNQLYLPKKFKKYVNPSRPIVGAIYETIIWLPLAIICFLVGSLLYFPSADYSSYDPEGVDNVSRLYGFADLLSSWTSVFCFAFIVFALWGGLKNRKTNRIPVKKVKFFVPMTWCAVVVVSLTTVVLILQPFIDLFLAGFGKTWKEYVISDGFIANVALIVTFFLFIALTLIPTLLQLKNSKHLKTISK